MACMWAVGGERAHRVPGMCCLSGRDWLLPCCRHGGISGLSWWPSASAFVPLRACRGLTGSSAGPPPPSR